ncbi:ANTAR domain-containing protein [Arthrobacter echini]|uniref:ANTAR domain-containing protein n=1 Tax=Arthrobacter echini TaxID=1529066 RepID=UPI00292A3FDF|nr:ANTAR domain-containing protein [Arthrobacter echini]
MNLFRVETGELNAEDIAIGQALADVSTISILQERTIRESAVVNEQLQRALNSRILIEQAKGMLAYTADIDTAEAFQRLRAHARIAQHDSPRHRSGRPAPFAQPLTQLLPVRNHRPPSRS